MIKPNVPSILIIIEGGVPRSIIGTSDEVNIIIYDIDKGSDDEPELIYEKRVEVVGKLSDSVEVPDGSLAEGFLLENDL